MKTLKIKHILHPFLIALLTLLLVIILGQIIYPDPVDVRKIKSFHSMPKNSYDVIGYGSSHIFAAMDPVLMHDEYGISAYNYGADWQKPDNTLLFIRDSLKTQSPKLAIIETYMVESFKDDHNLDGETFYTRAVHVNKLGYLHGRFGGELFSYAAYYLPLLQFHGNWPEIDFDVVRTNGSDDDFDDALGQARSDTVVPIVPSTYSEQDQKPISQAGIERLDEIVGLCRDNGMDVLFITTPMEESFFYSDAMTEYAKEHGCGYIDLIELMDEVGIDGETDFYDSAHLNVSGAEKASRYLGQYITDNYSFSGSR